MVTCRHNLGSFNRWIAIEEIIAGVCTINTLLRAICKMYGIRCDIHIVKQQEVVTYMSPVEVFMTRNMIFNWQKLPLIDCLTIP